MAHDANRRSRHSDGLSLRNTATVQHLDHEPNSAGSGSSFTISGMESPRTIRAGRPRRVSIDEVASVGCVSHPASGFMS